MARMRRTCLAILCGLLVVAGAAACASVPGSHPAAPDGPPLADLPSPGLPDAGLPPPKAEQAPPLPPLHGSGGCGQLNGPGDSQGLLSVEGNERSYRLHIPIGYQISRPVPLVLNYHGSGRMAIEQESYSGLIEYADREGFILVSPQAAGYEREWDIVGIYGDYGIDDVGFTAAMLDRLEGDLCIDLSRVFATGMSNGAEMASEAACKLPARFAAVAPVSGVIYDECEAGAVPVISFHGTDDWNVPFDYVPGDMASWAAHNGCTGGLVEEAWTASIDRQSYDGCAGSDVILFVIRGGGHQWPGASDESGGVGHMTQEISATALIWDFFRSHPKS